MYLRLTTAAVSAALLGLPALFNAGPASAHEHRAVGNYQLVVGFVNEPALAFEPNGLFLDVSFFANGVPEEVEGQPESEEEQGEPVEGLDQTLEAEVIVGGGASTMPLTLEGAFGEPGVYHGNFIPTLPGDYTFRVFGDIQGQEV